MPRRYFDLPSAKRLFETERAATLRARARALIVLLGGVWALQLALADRAVFATWACLALRVPEALANVGLWVALRRNDLPLARVERRCVTWCVVMTASAGVAAFGAKPEVMPLMAACYLLGSLAIYGIGLRWRAVAATLVVTIPVGIAIFVRARASSSIAVGTMAVPYALLTAWTVFREREQLQTIDTRLELVAINERLRATEVARSRLFVNLSHDLRTPLAVIRADAEHLSASVRATSDRRALERIERNATTLAELTAQLLDLARLDEGRVPKALRNVDLVALGREVCTALTPPQGEVVVEMLGSDAVAWADARHVKRVLANVIGNAVREVRRAPGRGIVSVQASRDASGQVVVDITDDGPGVPPERRAHLFERFAHFDPAGSVASGIGLALARELAEVDGGSLIFVADAPRTTFRLTLPAATGPADPLPWNVALLATNEPSVSDGASAALAPTLLVVEDSPDMADVLDRLLSTQYRVRRAAGIREAFELARRLDPVAIVADVMLPDGTAYELLSLLRADAALAVKPVVLVSALGESAERARGLDAGAQDYVAKPFSSKELLARVRAAIAHAEERRRALSHQRHELALELHDGVAGDLARAAVLLSAPPDGAETALAGARAAVRDGLDEVRSLMWTTQHAPEWRELVANIRRSLAESCEAARLSLVFRATARDESARLTPTVAHALRRIVQEATTNAVRHSAARSLTCVLAWVDDTVKVHLEDDGRGFEERRRGHGLAGIQRRARSNGGHALFSTGPAGGAVVEVSLRGASVST